MCQTIRSFLAEKKNALYCAGAVFLIFVALARIVCAELDGMFLTDFSGYCANSYALFRGHNPFPDHLEYIDIISVETTEGDVASVGGFPAQMLLFALPGFLWGNAIQVFWIVLNIAIIFFLTGLTLVKACGYRWNDLWTPGEKQFYYAVCCFLFLFSQNAMNTMRLGQLPVILAFLLYGMFWLSPTPVLSTLYFALIAAVKYSVLPVFAPLLFFKGHWKLCIAAFSLFVLFCISPAFCGNDLKEVYVGYYQAVVRAYQPGSAGHFDTNGVTMCHLGFFKNVAINSFLKAVVICCVIWLFWRERKSGSISDTLLMLALSLTMLISYHQTHDLSLVFPLFFIRFFAFAREKKWHYLGVEVFFLLILLLPGKLLLIAASFLGGFFPENSFIYLSNRPWGQPYLHLVPIMAFWSIAFACWNLHLYLHEKRTYLFMIPEPKQNEKTDPADAK